MGNDEQLIADIRQELDRELAHLQPSPGVIEAAWTHSGSGGRTPQRLMTDRWPRVRRRAVALIALGAAVPVAAMMVLIALLGHHNSQQPPPANTIRSSLPTSPPLSPAAKAELRPLTSILSVLRQPQTSADRNPTLIRYLRGQDRNAVAVGLAGRPVLSLMRLATVTPWGQQVYMVPFLAPTAAEHRKLPRKLRSGGPDINTATMQLYLLSGNTITIFNGSTDVAEIEGGRALGNGAYDTKVYNHPRQVIMVLPDGVTKAALWYPTRSIANHPKHPTAPGSKPFVVNAHNNIAAFIAPLRFERAHHDPFWAAGHEIWYGPDGHVVKRIDNANSCGPPLGACA